MGTTTTNYSWYKPAEHEGATGASYHVPFNANWDDLDTKLKAHADSITDLSTTVDALGIGKIVSVRDPAFAGGAQPSTIGAPVNATPAIQAAIDTHAKVVWAPSFGVNQFYGIGTPLVPYGSQIVLGDGADHPDFYRPGSELRCIGANTLMWDCSGAAHADFCVWKNLGFVDKVGPGGSGGVDTFFKNGPASAGTGYSMNGCSWIDCIFAYGQWAIDVTVNGFSLSNWLTRCHFWRPAIRNLGTFPNNWHFTDCQWNGMNQQVPAVEAGTGTDVTSSGPANGWFFEGGYTESLQRQFIKWIGGGLSVHDFYVEAINDSGTTYTAKDGRTLPLPWVDVCNNNVGGYSRGVTIDRIHAAGPGNTSMVVGSTVFTNTSNSGYNADITLGGSGGFGWQNVSETRTTWDLSTFKDVKGLPYFDEFEWPGNVYDLAYHDAQLGRVIRIQPTATTAITVRNPTNPSRGRQVTFLFISDGIGTLGAISWGNKYVLESAFASPTNNKVKSISFTYNFSKAKWYETGRTGEMAI